MSMSRPERWCEPSEIPPLGQSEIQIWKINLAAPTAGEVQLQNFLSAEERGQAARFHSASDQRRFIIRRAVLRQLLATHLQTKPEAVRFKFSSHGKPAVSGQEGADGLRFSCSHSADLGLIALARGGELGVDLEQHRKLPDAADLAKTFFFDSETHELVALPPSLKTIGFFNCWTRKEAFVKAIGLGLSFPLNRFSVSLTPGHPAVLLNVADDSDAAAKWTMASLDVIPDYSAALVFEHKNSRIKLFQWNSQLLD